MEASASFFIAVKKSMPLVLLYTRKPHHHFV